MGEPPCRRFSVTQSHRTHTEESFRGSALHGRCKACSIAVSPIRARNTTMDDLVAPYPRCCSIFSTMCAFGTTPTIVSTCWPFLNKSMLGIERTAKRIAVF